MFLRRLDAKKYFWGKGRKKMRKNHKDLDSKSRPKSPRNPKSRFLEFQMSKCPEKSGDSEFQFWDFWKIFQLDFVSNFQNRILRFIGQCESSQDLNINVIQGLIKNNSKSFAAKLMFFNQNVTNKPQPNASSTTTLPHELDITTDEFIIFWKLLEFSPVTGNASSTPLDYSKKLF